MKLKLKAADIPQEYHKEVGYFGAKALLEAKHMTTYWESHHLTNPITGNYITGNTIKYPSLDYYLPSDIIDRGILVVELEPINTATKLGIEKSNPAKELLWSYIENGTGYTDTGPNMILIPCIIKNSSNIACMVTNNTVDFPNYLDQAIASEVKLPYKFMSNFNTYVKAMNTIRMTNYRN